MESLDEFEPTLLTIVSNAVGYYHLGTVPLEVGHKVRKGDNVGIVEALGIANDVESKWDGIIEEVFAVSGQAVEFGQPLATLREI
jgi:acetyl-CoA carboxylase biotin carboxyl carrier protein